MGDDMGRHRTPPPSSDGVPVINIQIDSKPIKRDVGRNGHGEVAEAIEPEKTPDPTQKRRTAAKAIAIVGAIITPIVAVVWLIATMLSARPTYTDVRDSIQTSQVISDKVSHDDLAAVETRVSDVERKTAVLYERVDWISLTLQDMAKKQGVQTRPIPTDTQPPDSE
jgi:hypothetical protein